MIPPPEEKGEKKVFLFLAGRFYPGNIRAFVAAPAPARRRDATVAGKFSKSPMNLLVVLERAR
jgi:hypothetical protein